MNEPWKAFLTELDGKLTAPAELHCLGGFVIAEHYGLTRATADIDVMEVRGANPAALIELSGRNSALHKRYKVYLHYVTVAEYPYEYETRLIPVFENEFTCLQFRAFERHDLVLAKLARNIDRDRQDLEALAAGPGLDVELLKQRFDSEMKAHIGNPRRDELTLDLWIDIINELELRKGRS